MKSLLVFLCLLLSHSALSIGTQFHFKEKEMGSLVMWATNYYTPIYILKKKGFPLKTMRNRTFKLLGKTVNLSQKEWCNAAMEGSVAITVGRRFVKTYNYAGVGSLQVDCVPYFGDRFKSTGKVRFRESRSKWGEGIDDYNLIPYKTIAVDPTQIPFGSVLYIPKAKGVKYIVDGKKYYHDGFFFGGDKGGAIKGLHIDVFTGNSKKHNFKFIKSNPNHNFVAYLVKDQSIIKKLTEMHLKNY